MSCFGLHFPKKLKTLPSSTKKAWHSFTSSLQPKLHRLRRLKHRHFHRNPRRGGSYYSYHKSYKHQYRYEYQHLQQSSGANSPATVYVDRLYGEASSSKSGNTSDVAMKTAEVAEKKRKEGGGGGGVRWKEYISSLPKIKGVDERAEEFISKFRQQMQLQRQQSILDFNDMLTRSA